MVGIYKITNPKGRIYIGQSINLDSRRSDYKSERCKGQIKLHRSLKKYGFVLHIFEVIEECEVGLLNDRERYWQDFYQVLGEDGLNLKLTTTSNKSGAHSEETKLKISNTLRGHTYSTETRERISNSLKGRPCSEETRRRRSESMKHSGSVPPSAKGKKRSEETKRKMSEAAKSRKNKI
jgi:group I intron endonuclease